MADGGSTARRRLGWALLLGLSGIAAALLVVHLVWPDRVDMITLILLVLVALPGLGLVLDSAELPGGVKVQFRTLERRVGRTEATADAALGAATALGAPPAPGVPAAPGAVLAAAAAGPRLAYAPAPVPAVRRYCGSCGSPTRPADRFCLYCGVALPGAATAASERPAPSTPATSGHTPGAWTPWPGEGAEASGLGDPSTPGSDDTPGDTAAPTGRPPVVPNEDAVPTGRPPVVPNQDAAQAGRPPVIPSQGAAPTGRPPVVPNHGVPADGPTGPDHGTVPTGPEHPAGPTGPEHGAGPTGSGRGAGSAEFGAPVSGVPGPVFPGPTGGTVQRAGASEAGAPVPFQLARDSPYVRRTRRPWWRRWWPRRGSGLPAAPPPQSAPAWDLTPMPYAGEVAELAARYEDLRARMRSGSRRTAAMNELFGRLSVAATRAAGFDAEAALRSYRAGWRLAGYAHCYATPRPGLLSTLLASVLAEPLPFNQYWGLRALGRVVALPECPPVPPRVYEDLVGLRRRVADRDSDRAQEIDVLLDLLAEPDRLAP